MTVEEREVIKATVKEALREELMRLGLGPVPDMAKIAALPLEERRAYWKSRRSANGR